MNVFSLIMIVGGSYYFTIPYGGREYGYIYTKNIQEFFILLFSLYIIYFDLKIENLPIPSFS